MAKRIGWSILALTLIAAFAGSAEAQKMRGPFRFLGHGIGPGYHRCNPGPDGSYYNAWSQKNSYLVSQSPIFIAKYGNEMDQTPIQMLHSGRQWQEHAPMKPYPLNSGTEQKAAGPLKADFVPAESNTQYYEEPDDEKTTEDGPVEDRFEDEAESIEASKEAEADAQASPSDDNPGESVSTNAKSGTLFMPTLFSAGNGN